MMNGGMMNMEDEIRKDTLHIDEDNQLQSDRQHVENDNQLQSGRQHVENPSLVNKLLNNVEEDNHWLLLKQAERIQRAGLELPTVEVRYQNLNIEADEVVHLNQLPTLWHSSVKRVFSGITSISGLRSHSTKIKILEDFCGIIKPSRLTLLLGPPGCGKTTLLLALAGKLNKNLKVTGNISYNGYRLNEFVAHKTSAYVSQYDHHISELTVRETLDFAARCQGIGRRAEIVDEVIKREKQAGIIPELDIDTYMKATAVKGLNWPTLQTDYILKILGLDNCADTVVGDAMRRGISGGQKRRLTTGEMLIGPSKVLFMDEISNGLDTSTTFQIVTCLQQLAHIAGSTILISLLQPAPETFELFDDIILMTEGRVIYHGPRTNVLEFFEGCGFRCPPRKGIADFLQEVVSKKDQVQYWYRDDHPPMYVSAEDLARKFKEFHVGHKLYDELYHPFRKSEQDIGLSFNANAYVGNWEVFKVCMAREWLLMKRNSFIHAFKSAQLVVAALITMTMFIRTRTNIDGHDARSFMASLFYSLIRLTVNALPELPMTVSRLAVFYKQRNFHFYPAWAYSIPAAILKIPFSCLDCSLWTALTYYVIGYSPEPERFFRQFLILFLVNQVSVTSFRLIASIFPNHSSATFCGLFYLVAMYLFCGFIVPLPSLPRWMEWGFWVSPLAYAEIGVSINEFLAPRWEKVSYPNATIGHQVLTDSGLNYSSIFYWISIGALVGFVIFLNFGFTCTLSFSMAPGGSRAIISHEQNDESPSVPSARALAGVKRTGVVLPFEPMAITFENLQYFVDTPKKMRDQGLEQKRLQLLQDITGSFRPGILTALMGVSGAGKTTLLDVLSGCKSSGTIEGDIRIGGYPKVQDTYARISGYCEQSDIHSPQVTIKESLTYSAWLRLPPLIHPSTKSEFVEDVLQMIELNEIKDALVGRAGVNGISNEQRKRLTIAVELVSNPSIIFMDEPTSGLDARAAAIVMRVVKNVVNTGRTVVCTIHQPSIDIFEAFDELILMKRGGQIIYSGELGQHSSKLIKYFENIPGVPKIQESYNPATWMLNVSSSSMEEQLKIDFGQLYRESHLCRETKERVRELFSPPDGSEELHFSTRFPQNGWEQFKACVWKQSLSYWRSPNYNLGRLIFIIMTSLLLGAILWRRGQKIDGEEDLLNIVGAMFIFMQFMGISNCGSVQSLQSAERAIVYRERFSGMYSSWAYSVAKLVIEIPYIFLQAVLFLIITYPAIGFYWSVEKVFWYFYTIFCTLLYSTYLGMLLVSMTPSLVAASVAASFFNTMTTLFSGFLIPGPQIAKWWTWCYWILPGSWSLRLLITSQYGDIDEELVVFEERKAINAYLESYYGYHYNNLTVAALVLIAFSLVFAFGFAYFTAKLNFLRR